MIRIYTGTEGLKFWNEVEKQMKEKERQKLGLSKKK